MCAEPFPDYTVGAVIARRNIMLGTAGHVDHGKTALVKLLTGCDTDTLAEEKQRGLTIDLGFAPCRLADQRVVGIVDVPGHVDFIRNMVAGAHGIDVVILVVAADDGIMPQTREHMHILTLMGVRHGLVALTKIDLVDVARRNAVTAQLREMLAGTFLANAPICPISNVTGEGFDAFYEALNSVVSACADRPCNGIFRMWVEDVFTIRGAGTVITGVPTGGVVRLGQMLRILPLQTDARVRRIQVYGRDTEAGRAGECVALNMPELDHEIVQRGMMLCEPDMLEPVRMAEAWLQLLPDLKTALKDNSQVHLHIGTAVVQARVALLENPQLAPGQSQFVQLRLANPLPIAYGDRFVLRANLPAVEQSGLTTVGGGQILGTSNIKLRRNRPWTIAMLRARRDAVNDHVRWTELMLYENDRPMTFAELQRKCLLHADEAKEFVTQLISSGRVIRTVSNRLLHRVTVDRAAQRIVETITAFHSSHPQLLGVSRTELMTFVGLDTELFELALGDLAESHRLEQTGTVLAIAGWRARLTDRDRWLGEQVEAAFKKGGLLAPDINELGAQLSVQISEIEKAVKLLLDRGVLVQLSDKIIMHRDAIDVGKQVALELFRRNPSFTTMQFRDALGVSRKYAVPLLDYLDRVRFTVRTGNIRTPGVEAKKFLK